MPDSKALSNTLQFLEDETEETSEVVFGDVVESLNHRGFGPLLMAPAIITILPTGAIPGVPFASGVFIFLVAGQILIGRHYPWLPKKLKEFSFQRQKLLSAINQAKPYTQTIDRYIHPRLETLSGKSFQIVIAGICCLLAIGIAFIGFVPMLPALISLPILFFALGISAKDGVMILSGFALTAVSVCLMFWLLDGVNGEDKIKIGAPEFSNAAAYSVDLNALD